MLNFFKLYQEEFRNYSLHKFRQDLLAGLTVSAVALPLALAFGVASGSTAAAGLVTAIVAGIIIGLFSGAPYQISGPTGAMSAVLIVLVQRYGLQGIWAAGFLSGIFLIIIGILKLGRFINFIPSAVVTGFLSGISIVIFVGQIDNFLGINTPAAESALFKLMGYFQGSFIPNWNSVLIGLVVFFIMVLWPKKLNLFMPASLLSIILGTMISTILNWPLTVIGEIPQTLILDYRFDLFVFDWSSLQNFIAPALTITALNSIESLLCGAAGSSMSGIRLNANQELIGQGIGNMIIPFFGGVPGTAAIVRTSVGIQAGGQTRLVSIFHAIGVLFSMFLFAPIIARIPLTALAGMLMMTAIRMNDWSAIKRMFKKRYTEEIVVFSMTLIATISLDLTQAILLGTFFMAAIFLNSIAGIDVVFSDKVPEKLLQRNIDISGICQHRRMAFIIGPLFSASVYLFNESFLELRDTHVLILSMSGVPLIDSSGVTALENLCEKIHSQGGIVMFSSLQEKVYRQLDRTGLVEKVGENNFFWSDDQAFIAANKRKCKFCQD